MKKVFFFDIDGTFLSEKTDEILPSVKYVYEQLIANNHDVYLCTGRNRRDARKITNQLNINSFICSNGQYIEIKGKEYYSRYITEQEKLDYLSELENVVWGYMTNDDVKIIENESGIEKDIFCEEWMEYSYATKKDYFNDDVLTIIIIDNKIENYPLISQNNNMYLWNNSNFDVMPNDINKGIGIKKLLEKYDEPVEVFAFGDNFNDVQMFEVADNAICMGNGCDVAKKAADFVTKKASEDGILYALKKYGVINE